MWTIRGRRSHSGDTPSVSGTAPLGGDLQQHNPLKNLLGGKLFRGFSLIRRARSHSRNRSVSNTNEASSTVENSNFLVVSAHPGMDPVSSDRASILVHNQDIMVQVASPSERDDLGTKPVPATADIGSTSSSVQLIDFFDVPDQPFMAFDKVVLELTNVGPRTKAALKGLSWASLMIPKHQNRDRPVYRLLWKISEIYEFVAKEGQLKKLQSAPDVLAFLSEQVVECTKFVVKYHQYTRLWIRLDRDVHMMTDAAVNRCLDSLDSILGLLRGHTSKDALPNIYRVMQDSDVLAFSRVPHTAEVLLDSTQSCLEGTRREILEDIIEWAYSEDDTQRVYWLSGDEGTGKSAIIRTIAQWLRESGRLGSFFRFDIFRQAHYGPEKVCATIAKHLAVFDPELEQHMMNHMSGEAPTLITQDILQKWRNLVLDPLTNSGSRLGPVVLVIDALDECTTYTSREAILLFLANEFHQLPSNIRILVTSRTANDIRLALQDKSHIRTTSLDGIPRECVDRDIRLYISHRLPVFSDEQYNLLVTKADGLFEWARIACDFILSLQKQEGMSSDDLSEHILSPSRGLQSPLDQLYLLVLKLVLPDSLQARYQFGSVMRQILGMFEPLPIASLNEMRRFFSVPEDHFDVEPILRSISPLVSGVADRSSPVIFMHSSFRDFLLDRARSGDFFVDLDGIHQELVSSSLSNMVHGLQFNMCGLKNSYLQNSDVPDLSGCINERISPHLSYSCRFWFGHIHNVPFETQLGHELRSLFWNERLLFWLEVLGLLGCIDEVHAALTAARSFIGGRVEYNDTLSMIYDTRKFVEMFGNIIERSTLHMYLSALPLSPSESLLSRLCSPNIRRVPRKIAGHDATWPSSQLSLTGHADWVRSVAISRDGKQFASSSDDATIRVWDAETGLELGKPLEHGGFIMTIAFSPDDSIIVSGSSDRTICVWNSRTGSRVGKPLRGHAGPVNAVAFSPDGVWVASGSSDRTIRIWNVNTHTQVRMLEGHTDPINSVAVSFSGDRIASGSSDGTIQVWNTSTWLPVVDPIRGASSINAVAFSPDGKFVASGSDDSVVRLWDYRTCAQVGTLEGHVDHVTSVAFSVDSKYIVSGSTDRTVRVWDAVTHAQIESPLAKHTGKVSSVAISHDGRTIVSGSWDCSVRTWDTRLSPRLGTQTTPIFSVALLSAKKQIVSGSFDGTFKVFDAEGRRVGDKLVKGHASAVTSIAISVDGTRMASGSSDKTIRIWDVDSQTEVGNPLRGHTSRVNSVAFSPNAEWVVSASDDGTIRVWDVASSQTRTVLNEHKDAVNSISFSRDGNYFVSGSADKTIRVWDAATWSVVGASLTGHERPVSSVALSPDGTQIASGSLDNTVRLWIVQARVLVHTFEGHTSAVRSVVFSPDGRYLLSGSDDGTVCVWDVQAKSQIGRPLVGHTSRVRSVAIDAEWIVSGSEDGTIRVWDLSAALREDSRGKIDRHHHVRFSPFAQHALPDLPSTGTDTEERVCIDEDGWVRLGSREHPRLLFCVPTHWRSALWWYSTVGSVMVIPRGVELDLSEVVHGERWAECWVR